jgi:hypothetical protein
VSGEVSLPIAINIQPPDHPSTLQRLLPDASVNRLAAPCYVARKTNIDGYQHGHSTIFSRIPATY